MPQFDGQHCRMGEYISPQLPFGSFGPVRQLTLASIPKLVSGDPQLISGLPQTPRKQGDEASEKRRDKPIVNVKKLRDFNQKELSDLIAGAVFFLGLFSYFAYFVVARDDRKKENDQGRTSAEPK